MDEKRPLKSKSVYIVLAVLLCLFIVFSVCFYLSSYERSLQSFACGSVVNIKTYGGLSDATKTAAEEIKKLDSEYISANDENSLVYALNRDREIEDSSGVLVSLLDEYLDYSADCDKFSLMCGDLKTLWDMEGKGYLPSKEEIAEVLPGVSDSNILIDKDRIQLTDGMLDPGALGKGTACQLAIEKLKSEGIKNALVSVGGSIGVIGHPKSKKTFTIGIRNPFEGEDSYFATIDITDTYVSTSGDYEKYIEIGKKKYCHIFDAQTGYPKDGDITSVTAVADNGSLSDFLSTALFLEDEKKADALADKYNASYITVKKDRTVLVSEELKDVFRLQDDSFTVRYI